MALFSRSSKKRDTFDIVSERKKETRERYDETGYRGFVEALASTKASMIYNGNAMGELGAVPYLLTVAVDEKYLTKQEKSKVDKIKKSLGLKYKDPIKNALNLIDKTYSDLRNSTNHIDNVHSHFLMLRNYVQNNKESLKEQLTVRGSGGVINNIDEVLRDLDKSNYDLDITRHELNSLKRGLIDKKINHEDIESLKKSRKLLYEASKEVSDIYKSEVKILNNLKNKQVEGKKKKEDAKARERENIGRDLRDMAPGFGLIFILGVGLSAAMISLSLPVTGKFLEVPGFSFAMIFLSLFSVLFMVALFRRK